MKFQKEDKVKLSSKSKYWEENSRSNPRNMIGEVMLTGRSSDSIHVIWANGERNVYSEKDLEFAYKEARKNLLSLYNEFKVTPPVEQLLPPDDRVDLKVLAESNSFEEIGVDYEYIALLLSKYENAIRRLEKKLEFFELLHEDTFRKLEKGETNIKSGKAKVVRVAEESDENLEETEPLNVPDAPDLSMAAKRSFYTTYKTPPGWIPATKTKKSKKGKVKIINGENVNIEKWPSKQSLETEYERLYKEAINLESEKLHSSYTDDVEYIDEEE